MVILQEDMIILRREMSMPPNMMDRRIIPVLLFQAKIMSGGLNLKILEQKLGVVVL